MVVLAIETKRDRIVTVKYRSGYTREEWRGETVNWGKRNSIVKLSNSHDAVGGIEESDWHGTRAGRGRQGDQDDACQMNEHPFFSFYRAVRVQLSHTT